MELAESTTFLCPLKRTPMSKLDTQAAKKRCEAAGPGPWKAERREPYRNEHIGGHTYLIRAPNGNMPVDKHGIWEEAEAEFIAHARTDLPAALEELEKTRGLLRRVKETRHDEHLIDRHIALEAVEDYLGESE